MYPLLPSLSLAAVCISRGNGCWRVCVCVCACVCVHACTGTGADYNGFDMSIL